MKKTICLGILYVCVSCVCGFSIAGAAWTDQYLGSDSVMESILKLLLILALGLYIVLKKQRIRTLFRPVKARYFLLALLPILMSLGNIYNFERALSFEAILLILIGVLLTAVWEELLYRYIGVSLFQNSDGKLSAGSIVFLVLVFSSIHAINIIVHPVADQLLAAACFGLFALALYKRTNNIAVVILSHFLMNISAQIFSGLSDYQSSKGPLLDPSISEGFVIADLIAMAGIGILLLILDRKASA